MAFQQDWEKIRSCFTAMRLTPKEAPAVKTRQELVIAAARLMKPRADIKRLVSQINFICFDIVD